jgi:hypothetical protein
LTCLFEGHPLRIGQCEGEPVPPGIERRFDDARRLVLKALEAEKPRSARRLLRRAAHRLGKAARAVGKASRARRPSKRLGSHCAAGLSTILRAVQARAKEYAAGL